MPKGTIRPASGYRAAAPQSSNVASMKSHASPMQQQCINKATASPPFGYGLVVTFVGVICVSDMT